MSDFLTLAKERYSVRKFVQKPVAQADIDRILLAGQSAPTGCNYQPQHVFVMQSEEALAKCANAPNATLMRRWEC